jgi:hypothetical protein
MKPRRGKPGFHNRTLVHTEDGTAVASVMIGGRLVVGNHRLVTVDLERLRDRVTVAQQRLAPANADNRRLYEALEPVVGSYCPGLARTPYHSTATAHSWSNYLLRQAEGGRWEAQRPRRPASTHGGAELPHFQGRAFGGDVRNGFQAARAAEAGVKAVTDRKSHHPCGANTRRAGQTAQLLSAS